MVSPFYIHKCFCGQYYASSTFTGTRSPWTPSTLWRRNWRPSWGQNLVWGCSPHLEHLHSKSTMRTESAMIMFAKPKTLYSKSSMSTESGVRMFATSRKLSLWPHHGMLTTHTTQHDYENRISGEMFTISRTHHDYENRISGENAYHTQNTSYENRISREDVHHTQNTSYENRNSREDVTTPWTPDQENIISHEEAHHTQNICEQIQPWGCSPHPEHIL